MAVGVTTNVGVKTALGVYTGVTCVMTLVLSWVLWRNKEVRLVEVFNNEEQERNAKVSPLQRSWGTRWTEVNGMEWNDDVNVV